MESPTAGPLAPTSTIPLGLSLGNRSLKKGVCNPATKSDEIANSNRYPLCVGVTQVVTGDGPIKQRGSGGALDHPATMQLGPNYSVTALDPERGVDQTL
jgi:hypothetical protein